MGIDVSDAIEAKLKKVAEKYSVTKSSITAEL